MKAGGGAVVSVRRQALRGWARYMAAVVLVAITTVPSVFIGRFVAPVNLVMLYLAAMVISAMYLGRRPSILAALLTVVVFDFFVVPPRHTFAVADTEYLLTFAGLLIVGLVISSLTGQVRDQAEAAHKRESQAIALYEFSRDLSSAEEDEAILSATITHVGRTFGRHVAIFLPSSDGKLHVSAASPGFSWTEAENRIAERTFQAEPPGGPGAATYMLCLPLRTPRGVVGVLGVTPGAGKSQFSPDQFRLLETFASQAALAVERAELAERARQARLLEATEKLYSALLNSISHDLRTPLVTITGAFSSLETASGRLDEATRTSLAQAGREEAERLNQLVGDLLDLTRIEAGALVLTEELADVGEAIGVVLDRLSDRLKARPVHVAAPPDLAPVPMDMPLIVQALVNIVDNAAKYSPDGSPIDIRAWEAAEAVRIEVGDRGAGIPAEDQAHVFDRFYRVRRPSRVSGTGLGLSISKGIVEAHGGTIAAANRPGGGTLVTIELPLRRDTTARAEG